jgi:hypothetical protein
MNNQHLTKPEPISAKLNWHYDAYFLSQLEKLGLRKINAEHSAQDLDSEQPKAEFQAPEPPALKPDSEIEAIG